MPTARVVVDKLRDHPAEQVAAASVVLTEAEPVLIFSGEDVMELVRRGRGVLSVLYLGDVVEVLGEQTAGPPAAPGEELRNRGGPRLT